MNCSVLKYSLSVTKSHVLCQSYSKHVVPINDLFKANHGEGILFGDSIGLDMDELEKILAPQDEQGRPTPNRSCDLAMGVTGGQESLFLLAEFKIDVQSRRGLNRTELIEKYEQSKKRIEKESSIPVCSQYPIVLGNHEFTEVQKYKIQRWNLEVNGSRKQMPMEPVTEQEFYQKYWN